MSISLPKVLPTIPVADVKKTMKVYIKAYPNQAAIIQSCIEGALILEKICLDNYEAGGHRFYETKSLFSWDEGEREFSWNKDKNGNPKQYCETYDSFAYYVLISNGDIKKAAKDMLSDLGIFDSYARDIEATAW